MTAAAVDTGALSETPWFVYLLVCRGGRLYAGVTPDLAARMRKHIAGTGAKFTRSHPPESLLAAKSFSSRSEAQSVEHQVKQMTASGKRALASAWTQELEIGDDVRAVFAASDERVS